MKKFLFISESQTLYNRQKYIIESLKKAGLEIDILFLEDIFQKYDVFKYKHFFINHAQSFSKNLYILDNIIKNNIKYNEYLGVILTYELTYTMQRVMELFSARKIKTFLIFHEGVFFDIKKWYKIPSNHLNSFLLGKKYLTGVPKVDFCFPWGEIHKQELLDRGYSGKIYTLGTNKFEKYKNLHIEKTQVLEKIGICSYNSEKILTYVCQLFDNQIDTKEGLYMQNKAINDLIQYCEKKGYILIIRSIVGLKLNLPKKNFIYIDGLDGKYNSQPEENLYISDGVFGFNSTMLIESTLLSKPTYSFKYLKYHSEFATSKYMYEIKDSSFFINFEILKNTGLSIDSLSHLIGNSLDGNINEKVKIIQNETKHTNVYNINISIIHLINPIWILLLLKDYTLGLFIFLTKTIKGN